MDNEFLVLKWDDIENNLSDCELDLFYDLICKITEDDFEEDEYCIFKKSYIKGKELQKEIQEKNKEILVEKLEELVALKDVELAKEEALEIIVGYIGSKRTEKAIDKLRNV